MRPRGLVTAALTVWIAGSAAVAGVAQARVSIGGRQAQLVRVRQKIATVREDAAIQRARASADYVQFAHAQAAYGAASREATRLGLSLGQLNGQLRQTRKRLRRERRILRLRRRGLASALTGIQEGSVAGSFLLLLDARSLSDFMTRLYLFGELMKAEGLRMAEAAAQASRVHRTFVSLKLAERTRTNELATVRREAARLRVSGAAARSAYAHDQSLVAADAAGLDRLEEAAAALVAAIEAQRGASVSANPGRALSGVRFEWPVQGPITSPFGWRMDPVMHQYWLHTGMDIGVPIGTPVHAAAGGDVLVAGWETGYGNTVVIDDGGGISTLYAHLERILVQEGERVGQGEVVALSGMTGWATGPHVHFEIRVNGSPINPAPYLP